MAELHETRMGKTLIDSTFPRIAKELKRIADALELRNQADTLIRAKQEEEDLNSNPNSQLEKISDNILIVSFIYFFFISLPVNLFSSSFFFSSICFNLASATFPTLVKITSTGKPN